MTNSESLLVGGASAELDVASVEWITEQNAGSKYRPYTMRWKGCLADTQIATPEGQNVSMIIPQNDHHLFVADPIAGHILLIDVNTMGVKTDGLLNAILMGSVWLRINA